MSTYATAALAAVLIAIPVTVATSHGGASRTDTVTPPRKIPGLTISVTDGRVAAAEGDRLTYTVNVRDTGTSAVPHLDITQTLSAGLEFLSASGDGADKAGHVTWRATLSAGGTRTFRVVALVTRTPPHVTRLAAVACAALPAGDRPIVCAAHLDKVPSAGAEPAAASGSSGGNLLAYAATGLVVLALGLLMVIVGRRTRLRRRHARPSR
jgi:uncharacterized repeat protein (TIGR01451 family)